MINAGFLLILILYNGEKIHTIFLKVKVKNFYYKFWKNEKYFKYHFSVFSSGDTGPKVEILLIIQRQLPPQNLNIQKDNYFSETFMKFCKIPIKFSKIGFAITYNTILYFQKKVVQFGYVQL